MLKASAMISQQSGFYYKPALEARVADVELKISKLVQEELLREENLKGRVIDLCVGYGGSYRAFGRFSSDVTGVEPRKELADALVEYGIVPEKKLFVMTPLDYLESQEAAGFNLIAGLLLSRVYMSQMRELYEKSLRLLKVGGQLLLTTEKDTLPLKQVMELEKMLNISENGNILSAIFELEGFGQDDIALIATKLK